MPRLCVHCGMVSVSAPRPRARASVARSSGMGINIIPDEPVPTWRETEQPATSQDLHTFGLSASQMMNLGLTGDHVQRLQNGMTEDSLRASSHYVPTEARLSGPRSPATMRRAGRGRVLTPGKAPPDLPSLLLDSRIVFIGMPLVAKVSELIMSELLWLNYNQPDRPVYMYINSIGSQKDQQAVGFDTEAFAILDTMMYIRPPVITLVIGQAYGNACLLLAAGQKGRRAALPHSRIKVAPPVLNRSFGTTVDVMLQANELEQNTETYMDFMAKYTGRPKEEVVQDCQRDKYFTPAKAIEYGIIDRVLRGHEVAMDAKDYEGALQTARSRRPTRQAEEGPAAAT